MPAEKSKKLVTVYVGDDDAFAALRNQRIRAGVRGRNVFSSPARTRLAFGPGRAVLILGPTAKVLVLGLIKSSNTVSSK
jgi:hypothetical protein